jgi:hypothetical protein
MNVNIIKSGEGTRTSSILISTLQVDVNNYLIQGVLITPPPVPPEPQRVYPIMRWQFDDIFSLFDEAVFRVRRIKTPKNVDIALLPLDDNLKIHLLNDSTDDYYFVISKADFEVLAGESTIYSLIIAKSSSTNRDDFYIFLEPSDLTSGGDGTGGSATDGVRIPNPPVTPPPSN